MSSYFLLVFPLGFQRSFSDVSLHNTLHIFPEKVFWGSYLYVVSPILFPTGVFKWDTKDIVICLNHTNIHIPHIFPIGFLKESKLITTSISRRFD
jgi:hypothetical protein